MFRARKAAPAGTKSGGRRGRRRGPLLRLLLAAALGTAGVASVYTAAELYSYYGAAIPTGGLDEHPMFVFVHIPKAGGSSLIRVLLHYAEREHLRMAQHNDDFLSFAPEEQNAYAIVAGHMGFGIHRQRRWRIAASRPVRYLTFLRAPVSRVWSAYFFDARNNRLYNEMGHAVPPFDEWLVNTRRPEHDPWSVANNPNTQQLCCFNNYNHFNREAREDGDWETSAAGAAGDAYALCRTPDEETLRCAMENLEAFEFIGLVEQYVGAPRAMILTHGGTRIRRWP